LEEELMMKLVTISARGLAVVAAMATAAATWADDPKGNGKADNKLVGTWKRVSAKFDGKDNPLPAGYTQLKHVTPTQFMWAIYGEDGKLASALGGTYTLKGGEYVETPEYGMEGFDELKGKPQEFKWKVEGNKWYHSGKLSTGLTIEEVWERVEKK
jgi:hypothetical protein